MIAAFDIDPQVIIIFGAMIFAGLRALMARFQQPEEPPTEYYEEDEVEYDYAEYEAELARQRRALELESSGPPPLIPQAPVPAVVTPPPLVPQQRPAVKSVEKKATLSEAEKEALKNFEALSQSPRGRSGKSGSTKARLKRHLASPTAAREALLLSEILGPPKAMERKN